jgi:hypothetical protein
MALGCLAVRLDELPQAERTAGMSERRFRKPNAFKHGGFSKVELLPWEDVNEFEELHRGLKEEFGPEGPLQEDCVYTILSCMWRKRRVREKRNLDTAAALDRVENRVLWEDPPPLFDTDIEGVKYSLANRRSESRSKPPEDYQQLLGFSSSLYREHDKSLLELSVNMLPREFSSHLREKVPRENFESTRQWVVALKREVDTVLLPMVRESGHDPDAYLATAAAFLTGDRVLEDLTIEERLDAAIDRAMKRLYQLKVARQLDRPKLPVLVESQVPKQLEGPSAATSKFKEG